MSAVAAAPRRLALWPYNVALAAAAAGLFALALRHGASAPDAGFHVPWPALALAFYLAEAYVVHVRVRREAHTISLNELALVPGLFLLAPGPLVLAQLTGAAAALVLNRRQRPVKLAFNLAQFALATAAAVLVFHAVLGSATTGPRAWTAALAAAVVASLVGIVLVRVAIALAERDWTIREPLSTAAVSLVATVATASLALAGLELERVDARAFVLLLAPAAIVAVGFRTMMEQRRRHRHLEFLYESMQRTRGATEFGLAIGQLLIAVRRLVRAEYAEIFVLPEHGAQGVRSTLGMHGEMLVEPADVTVVDRRILELADSSSRPFLAPRPRANASPLDAYLAARGLADGVVALLRNEAGPFGLLVVGQRAGDVDTFGDEDADLLETFAGHASVLIENGRLERSLAEAGALEQRLRHQAYHDALTTLPNRALFMERVEAAVRPGRTTGSRTAVLFVDLDDFKAINDRLGHAVGDEVLALVGARVRSCTRPADVPARLGGDEFGMLLEPATLEDAERVAERLLAALEEPFALEGREIRVHASVGIATGDSAATAEELLRNADAAMYAAKQEGKGRHSIYESSIHARARGRDALERDLEGALDRGEIGVVYQPIVSLRTGRTLSYEGLARWHHPERGVVTAAEFVPAAAELGLLPTIGRHVLREACRGAREWQLRLPEHEDVGVAVNLSAGEFLGERLVRDVADALSTARLDPRSLTLEVVESAAMEDVDGFSARMYELRALGVQIALDDFGVGPSSLERLDLLPLNVLKIAKPFVDRLVGSSADASLVDPFVRLAYSLGFECVAEGVEQEIQVPRLLDRGCGIGQGFHLAEPMTLDALLAASRVSL